MSEREVLPIVVGAGAGTAVGVTLGVAASNALIMLAGPLVGLLIGSIGAAVLRYTHTREWNDNNRDRN